jgi:CheY-like chemotaxis protein
MIWKSHWRRSIPAWLAGFGNAARERRRPRYRSARACCWSTTTVISTLASRLEKCGLDVQYASDAQQDYRMARRDEPAVIVTDYFMPNGDAQYLLTRLRTTAATANISAIVLFGRQLSEVTEQCLKRKICRPSRRYADPEKIPGYLRAIRSTENILRLRKAEYHFSPGIPAGHSARQMDPTFAMRCLRFAKSAIKSDMNT